MKIKEDSVLFLLGAGCSYEASIPISFQMVNEVESLILEEDSEWHKFKDLYNYLKSSINYSEGIFGNFSGSFNIEKLLIVISEIEKRDRNIVYPFIGSWNLRLIDLAGYQFRNLSDFKNLIVSKLNDWILPTNYNDADYYYGFTKFQQEVGNPLKVFSLNYDLCFEKVVGKESSIADGFDKVNLDWHYSNFDLTEAQYHLFKLHGSIDWYIKHEEGGQLYKREHPTSNPELIFGVEAKLQSKDPYLFYIYQFRRYMFEQECKLLITIGYSFSDGHINDIIVQSLRQDKERKLLIVSPLSKDGYSEEEIQQKRTEKRTEIKELLKLKNGEENQLIPFDAGAKKFLSNHLNIESIKEYVVDNSEDNPF